MLGLTPLGLYGIGFRITSVVSLLMQAFQGAITPIIYSRYQEESARAEISRIFRLFVFFALLVFVAISLFAREIVMLLTTPAYHSAYVLVPFLVADQFLSGMYVFAPGLAIAKKTRYLAVINIYGAAFSVLMSIALIYLAGIIGAAIAASIKSFVLLVVQMHLSQKFYRVPHKYRKILLSFCSCTVLVLLGYAVDQFFLFQTSVFLKSLIFTLCIPTLICNGLVHRSEIGLYLSKLSSR